MGERENEAPTVTVEEVVERLRHLVSLNEPRNGGPYGGFAAEQCMTAMSDAASLLTTLQAERDAALRLVKMSVKAQAVEREHVARIAAEAERDALRTRVEEMGDLVGELHRLGLVLESAVRNADKPNHPAVLALIRRALSALSQEGQG